ncbi:hypothetical protein APHAL10511_002134 [Amanita phalloides]|nr:hypothetical protein APHAL10511_002134 [Amanita phalloides]
MSCLRLLRPRLSVTRTCSLPLAQTRLVRTKHGVGSIDASIKRDERLLKRLEAQLAAVQGKIKDEDEEMARLLQKYKKRGSSPGTDSDLQEHNAFFWEKILSKDERRTLASHDINSLDELASVHEAVQSKLSQPPHPKIEDLDSKSQYAYEIYQSIPVRLRSSKDKLWFNWF